MADLRDGESTEMKGSGAQPYVLKNTGGVYSCSCPAWRNQSVTIERRTCKHLRKLRGDAAEEERIGGALPTRPIKALDDGEEEDGPGLLLAMNWDTTADLSGWWMSEKLDGVRAFWDGKQFLSRQGNLFHAPDWFVEKLPDTPLDGELWMDRKTFQRTVSIVRRQDKSDLWRGVKYLIFDAPSASGGFEDRIAFLKDTFADREKKSPFALPHEHQLCRDTEHLRHELQRIVAMGGEGLMLREPGSAYQAGRSSTLLKVKTFHDAEAVVTGHEAGAGKHTGRLGALTVRLPSGVSFSVGTGFSDKERAAPPPVGATISFRYQELSDAGVPRFPSYLGIRADASPPVSPTESEAMSHRDSEVPASIQSKSAVSQPRTPKPASFPAASATSSGPRYFEFLEGTSNKFWEISQSGCEMTTHWGRIGTEGQRKTKSFADEAAAAKEVAKLIQQKTKEGYNETARDH